MKRLILLAALTVGASSAARAADQPESMFTIFQFPADKIPRVDGDPSDWAMVPDGYAIGMDRLVNDADKDQKPDPKNLDVKVKVGWAKGLNRLYFLYEAYDNYWDFT